MVGVISSWYNRTATNALNVFVASTDEWHLFFFSAYAGSRACDPESDTALLCSARAPGRGRDLHSQRLTPVLWLRERRPWPDLLNMGVEKTAKKVLSRRRRLMLFS